MISVMLGLIFRYYSPSIVKGWYITGFTVDTDRE
jgi:hypothetical protein